MEPVIRDRHRPATVEERPNQFGMDCFLDNSKEFDEDHLFPDGHKTKLGLRLEFNRPLPGRFDRVIIK